MSFGIRHSSKNSSSIPPPHVPFLFFLDVLILQCREEPSQVPNTKIWQSNRNQNRWCGSVLLFHAKEKDKEEDTGDAGARTGTGTTVLVNSSHPDCQAELMNVDGEEAEATCICEEEARQDKNESERNGKFSCSGSAETRRGEEKTRAAS